MATSIQTLSTPTLSERDYAEIARSASEASKVIGGRCNNAQVERYIDPPATTPFPLEYAFHLLGDIRDKTVVDLGCGTGENMVPLVKRGAHVTGIGISPDLIQLAQQRISTANISASARVGSAYDTGFDSESVDVILCVTLILHLDIPRVRDEVYRILKKNGYIVLSEPVRFSKFYDRVRKALPAQEDTSDFEHPLTKEEVNCMCGAFAQEHKRLFRLPFVAIPQHLFHKSSHLCYHLSDWIIRACPPSEHFATNVVVRLRKTFAA